MSQSAQPKANTCDNCGDVKPITELVTPANGVYCDEECRLTHKGEKLLRNIEQDHRFCATCYKPLRVVYRPAEGEAPSLRKKALLIRESFIGFQDLTEHAESGDYGVECDCGNIQHYHSEPTLRNGEPYEHFLNLAIDRLRNEGQFEYTFDTEAFSSTLDESDHFEYAVGVAIDSAH